MLSRKATRERKPRANRFPLLGPDGPTKGGKARTVYLTEEIRKIMIEHRRYLTEVAQKKRWGQLRVN